MMEIQLRYINASYKRTAILTQNDDKKMKKNTHVIIFIYLQSIFFLLLLLCTENIFMIKKSAF